MGGQAAVHVRIISCLNALRSCKTLDKPAHEGLLPAESRRVRGTASAEDGSCPMGSQAASLSALPCSPP